MKSKYDSKSKTNELSVNKRQKKSFTQHSGKLKKFIHKKSPDFFKDTWGMYEQNKLSTSKLAPSPLIKDKTMNLPYKSSFSSLKTAFMDTRNIPITSNHSKESNQPKYRLTTTNNMNLKPNSARSKHIDTLWEKV